MTGWIFSLAAGAALVTLLRHAARGPSIAKSVAKTASVALLAYLSWAEDLPALLTFALGLAALGDYFLSREGERAFLLGLGSFALSHLAYIALFLSLPGGVFGRIVDPVALPLSLGILLFAGLMATRLWFRTGALRIPVLVYVCILSIMALLSIAHGPPLLWAAILFVVSDALLGAHLFLWAPGNRWHRVAPYLIWGTYWPSQALFLLAFLGFAAL